MGLGVACGVDVKPKTEEFLYYLLWFTEQLCRPTYRNLDGTFEAWAYDRGLLRRLQELERQEFIERNRSKATRRMYRLTEKGRLHVLGGRDPEQGWNRAWDRRWRVVLFDLPRADATARKRLHKQLRAEGFGLLQHSVWISPNPLSRTVRKLCGRGDDVNTLLSFEGAPGAGERDRRIVSRAWNFNQIGARYREHQRILRRVPVERVSTEAHARKLPRWAEQERLAWRAVVAIDPFLPASLLPAGYPGRRAWQRRQRVLARAAGLILEPLG